jgi:hypothetical protein
VQNKEFPRPQLLLIQLSIVSKDLQSIIEVSIGEHHYQRMWVLKFLREKPTLMVSCLDDAERLTSVTLIVFEHKVATPNS